MGVCFLFFLVFIIFIKVLICSLPLVLSTALLIFDKSSNLPYEKRNPNFTYGASQAIVAVSLLVLCFISKFL